MHVTEFFYDDWAGLYFDGELVQQGHTIHDVFHDLLGKPAITKYTWIEGNYKVLGNLDPWAGRCPQDLQEILDYPDAIGDRRDYDVS